MLTTHRTDDSKLTDWYYGVDRPLLFCVLLLILVGGVAAISTGSAMMVFKNWHWYHFILNMLPFYIVGFAGMVAVSMTNKKWVLWIAWLNVIACTVLLVLTKIIPCGTYGSERWVCIPGVKKLMPSDLLKPGFVFISAWFITKMKEYYGTDIFTKDAFQIKNHYNWWYYLAYVFFVLLILVLQPDYGTAILYCGVVGGLLIFAGLPKLWIGVGVAFMAVGGTLAALFEPHVHRRVLEFIAPIDPTSQVGRSINAIRQGGLFGMGDEASVTEKLPMAENDFVYAALVENYGAIGGCLLLVCCVYMIQRLITDARGARDPFVYYAALGVMLMFAIQISINLATTLHLMPPTGITFPFVSFGGSAFLSSCLMFGMVLAIIREDKWK